MSRVRVYNSRCPKSEKIVTRREIAEFPKFNNANVRGEPKQKKLIDEQNGFE